MNRARSLDPIGPALRSTQYVGCCILQVDVATNVPQGGDAGHGGITLVTLTDLGGTCMAVERDPHYQYDQTGSYIKLIFRGDDEAHALAEVLAFAAATIRELVAENREDLMNEART